MCETIVNPGLGAAWRCHPLRLRRGYARVPGPWVAGRDMSIEPTGGPADTRR